MGKGSNIRPYDREKFRRNFERIFGCEPDFLEDEEENVPRGTGQKPQVEGDDSSEAG